MYKMENNILKVEISKEGLISVSIPSFISSNSMTIKSYE